MRVVRFVTATKASEQDFRNRPVFTSLCGRFDLYARLNNREGLPKVYNLFLEGKFEEFFFEGAEKGRLGPDDIIVFLHDDVQVVAGNVVQELNRWIDKGYSVLGLAGGAKVSVTEPAMWHFMTPPQFRSGTSIFHISHRISPTEARILPDFPYAATFGPLREVDILDGVFMAFALDAVTRTGFRFDEDFAFHHYDLAACLLAKRAGLLLHTAFIPVIHTSPGLNKYMEDEAWLESQRVFLRKYG